jgi:CheY-like chemotaxis protein
VLNVLIVEPSPGDVRLCREAFDEWGSVAIHHATNADDAWRFLRRDGEHGDAARPDFMLLAIHLPKKSGLEFLAEVRGSSEFKHIPIIVFTVSADPNAESEAYRMGADEFVHKPSDLEAFLTAVKGIADRWSKRASQSP